MAWARAIDRASLGLHDREALDYAVDCCLVCGRKLAVPFIYWYCEHPLAAHPACWAHVALATLRDCMELAHGKETADRWHYAQKDQFLKLRPLVEES